MLKKNLLLLFLFFSLSQGLFIKSSFASQQATLDLAVVAIHNKNWLGAKILLEPLHEKNSNDNYVSNLLAVVYFNIGKLELAQQLLTSVIESHQDTQYAYKNLEKLFSYSAAKTYSKGLNLLSPVEKPELLITKNTHSIKTNSDTSTKATNTVDEDVASNDNEVVDANTTEKHIDRTSFWQEQLQKTLADNDINPVEVATITTDMAVSLPTNEVKKSKNQDKHIEVLKKRLFLWQAFWMKGNAAQYISMYDKNYSPADITRQQWINNRYKYVIPEKKIEVKILNEKVELINDQLAVIKFEQHYQSMGYQDKVRKSLYWKKIKNLWYIYREEVVDVL